MNTATATDTNGSTPVDDSVTVVAEIPVVVKPVATKSWSPSSGIAQSGATSTVTLGIRNASSSSADVRALILTDDTFDTFNTFDLTALGPIKASPNGYPAGTDQVIVRACTQPIGSPCTGGQWIESAPQTGLGPFDPTAIFSPAVGLDAITGVQFEFSNSSDSTLPYSATDGQVELGLRLRDNYRQAPQDPIQPQTALNVTNEVTPVAVDQNSENTVGATANARYSVAPDTITVSAQKNMFADNAGNWKANGKIVVGQQSGVTATLKATNSSAGPVKSLTIAEPSTTTPTVLDQIDLSKGRFTWPSGATQATLSVVCHGGATPPQQVFTNTSVTPVNITDFGCTSGTTPTSLTLTYEGTDDQGNGTIAATASGQLDLHGSISDSITSPTTIQNCFDASAATPASSSAAAVACKSINVVNPSSGIGNVTKSTSGVDTIVPGQPMEFKLSFRNNGNVPIDDAYIIDPVDTDPSSAGNPFDIVEFTSISTSSSPAHVIEVWDPNAAAYVTYVPSDSALKSRATGLRVRLTAPLPVGATFRVTYKVTLRDLDPPTPVDTTFYNCAEAGAPSVTPTPDPVCSDLITVKDAAGSASLRKLFDPNQLLRPEPGLPAQQTTVKTTIFNGGPSYLQELAFTDSDSDFFDAVDFSGNMHVNFPPGANRVQVDACTGSCTSFVDGTPTASHAPGLPSGIDAADVRGLRVSFFHQSGGYRLIPVANYQPPTSGQCKNANFCFDVTARQFLHSGSSTPIPASIDNTTSGSFVWSGDPNPQPIPPDTDTLTIVDGETKVKFVKGPDSRIAPGDTAPFDLLIENTGTKALQDPVIDDPLPAELTLEDAPGGTTARPFVISYPALPAGYATLPSDQVDYVETGGGGPDPKVGADLRWTFTGWSLPPGGKVNIRIYVSLSPGVAADDVIPNTAGAGSALTPTDQFSCDLPDPSPTPDPYCDSTANITALAGVDVDSQKWTAGNPLLGWYDSVSGQKVPIGDPSCPRYTLNSVTYTKFPCAAITLPGGTLQQVIRMINAGTENLTEAVAVDKLPVQGDTGVILSNQQRGTQWNNRPTMLSPVSVLESYSGVSTDYTDAAFANICTTQLASSPTPCDPSDYPNATPSTSTTGFQTTMDFTGDPLTPGEQVTLVWTMKAPLTLDTTTVVPAEWNSFAQKSTFGSTVLAASEPLKTGSVMLFGALSVFKQVEGLPSGISVGDFTMAYECSYDGTVIASDPGLLVPDGGTSDLPLLPTGATCNIWEVDSQGGSSPNIGPDNAITQVVPDGIAVPAGIEVPITNSYQQGELTIRKTVSGGAAGLPLQPDGTVGGATFPFTVSCEFPDGGAELPGFPQSFELTAGTEIVINVGTGTALPAGSVCLVTETDTQYATTTTITADGSNPVTGDSITVTVKPEFDGGSDVMFDNVYEAGAITLQKTLSGPGASVAKGPFEFRFDCTYNSQTLAPITTQVTVESPIVSVTPLPLGATCDVSETDAGDSTTPVPTVIATDVVVKATNDSPITVTADNEYPTAPVCPLSVSARNADKPVKRNGRTVLVSKARTSDDCKVSTKKKKGTRVTCAPRNTARGDAVYCRTKIKKNGKIVVKTFGYPKVRIKATIAAVPKSGSPVTDSSTWKRKWSVR